MPKFIWKQDVLITVEWCRCQLYTIFVRHAEYAFPACFALMTRKTTLLYEAQALIRLFTF